MTAPRDCRPPENTPDGTVFKLRRNAPATLYDMPRKYWTQAIWSEKWWMLSDGSYATVEQATAFGWTIAEPPHE